MLIREALSFGREVLGNILEVEVLLSYALQKDRTHLLSHDHEWLQDPELQFFYELVNKRSEGYPIQYLTHRKEFFGLEFYVDERCFIPRPETELLVEVTLREIKKQNIKKPRILDIGTGSGAIAIALAKSLSQAKVTGVDISEEALEVAKFNAKKHGVEKRATFLKSDLLEAVRSEAFDVMVANLPYIGTEKFSFVEKEVRDNEPGMALFGGRDGLDIYRQLFGQIAQYRESKKSLALPNFFCLEFGFLQRKTLTKILNTYFVQILKDLSGLDRVCMVRC